MECSNCGAEVDSSTSYCPGCGAAFVSAEDTSSSSEPYISILPFRLIGLGLALLSTVSLPLAVPLDLMPSLYGIPEILYLLPFIFIISSIVIAYGLFAEKSWSRYIAGGMFGVTALIGLTGIVLRSSVVYMINPIRILSAIIYELIPGDIRSLLIFIELLLIGAYSITGGVFLFSD
jgi:hypothetical protein